MNDKTTKHTLTLTDRERTLVEALLLDADNQTGSLTLGEALVHLNDPDAEEEKENRKALADLLTKLGLNDLRF